MLDDKLKDLTPLSVYFSQGEAPTAEKLEGMMKQIEEGVEYLENTVGDSFNRTEYSKTWLNNIARTLGDLSMLSPRVLPSYEEENYMQDLLPGRVEHELDLIPTGVGSAIISVSNDASVVIGQFKSSVDLLENPGDWTIAPALLENGNQKNHKKLVTHSPAEGNTITFTKVTTGRGSVKEGGNYNLIPTPAQAETAGPFVTIALANEATNEYLFTLPVITKDYDKLGNIVDARLSNTVDHSVAGRNYTFPDYFFDPAGLDLASDDTGVRPEKKFPLNIMQIYSWSTGEKLEGIVEIYTSPIPSARKYQCTVKFKQDVLLDLNDQYMIVVNGTSISDYIQSLSDFALDHSHAGDDMGRHISHADLLDLRTSTTDFANRSTYYGPSSISNNDHSMYLHRNGFTDSDVGGGANIMRGNLVVGNTDLGAAGEHEHYNLNQDSFSLYFGHLANSAEIFYEKNAVHVAPEGRRNIPETYSGNALKVKGSVNDSNNRLNTILEGSLRVTKDVVLGSLEEDSLFVSGHAYFKHSLTLIPREQTGIPFEEGTMYYDKTEKELLVHNGSQLIAPGKVGIAAIVGDGINSFGKFNGPDGVSIQAGIDEASANGGGIVKVLKGTYDVGFISLTIPSNVQVVGEGSITLIKGSETVVTLSATSIDAGISNVALSGPNPGVALRLISIEGTRGVVSNIGCSFATQAIEIAANASHTLVESSITYSNCTSRTICRSYDPTNKISIVRPAGFTPDFRMHNWGDKEGYASKWLVDNGTIALSYEDLENSTVGRGAIKILGTGSMYFDELMPVSPVTGIAGYCDAKAIGSGVIHMGVLCYDKNYNYLGWNGGFLMSNVALPTSYLHKWGVQVDEGTAIDSFIAGTRFVRPYFSIGTNSAGIILDNFEIYPMTVSRVATYI